MLVVLIVESVPDHLRGYLERFLQEARTGIFVGTLSKRVVEDLWVKACAHAGEGDVVMIQPSGNEAGYVMVTREHPRWRVIDHDGWQLSATLAPGEG